MYPKPAGHLLNTTVKSIKQSENPIKYKGFCELQEEAVYGTPDDLIFCSQAAYVAFGKQYGDSKFSEKYITLQKNGKLIICSSNPHT